MEGQKTRVENEIEENREQSSPQAFRFDACSRSYSFSSNFILLLTKTVDAEKRHYGHLRVYMTHLYQSAMLGTACKQGLLVTRSGSPGEVLTAAPQVWATAQG